MFCLLSNCLESFDFKLVDEAIGLTTCFAGVMTLVLIGLTFVALFRVCCWRTCSRLGLTSFGLVRKAMELSLTREDEACYYDCASKLA